MYFTETPSLREIEKAMKMIPNFTPRGHGVVILCKHEFAEKSCIGDSQKEILARTVSRINNPLFQKRFQKYINESETIPMNFRNSKHSISFTDTIRKKNKKDYALMSALYLLTAEFALWQTAMFMTYWTSKKVPMNYFLKLEIGRIQKFSGVWRL